MVGGLRRAPVQVEEERLGEQVLGDDLVAHERLDRAVEGSDAHGREPDERQHVLEQALEREAAAAIVALLHDALEPRVAPRHDGFKQRRLANLRTTRGR